MSSTPVGMSSPQRQTRPKSFRWWLSLPVLLVLGVVVTWSQMSGHGEETGGHSKPGTAASALTADGAVPEVEVIHPRKGGIERVTVQPGSVHSFEAVDLYSMVSGYLKSQSVDIGSRVKKGDLLAEIDVPREKNAVELAAAMLDQAKAKALQAAAKVDAVDAERETAVATVSQTEADIDRLVSSLRLAESQYTRIKSLFERSAVPKSVVDENLNAVDAAKAAEKTARLTVQTAKAKLSGAVARVEQAKADVIEAQASVRVAETQLDKAKVDLGYANILAPFDGVVTRRNFHPGAFVRAATAGGELPLLTVVRTDLMRVVVRVPDRDVVLTNPGDPAVVTIDGVGTREFKGKVARIAESEDHQTRTMRVEIDLENPDRLLREGMYGRASIGLEALSERLTLPTACVLERSGKRQGVVQVVRDGKVERVKVELGADNGTLVEIDSGIKPDDAVVLRSNSVIEPGMTVSPKVSG
ncbi:RND family efflux transporter, MFP subunit [Singulisphaera sp. GP187]|uniref:efflux RND transporter periplasmic adaptor subunit n=1 Tax=Singulisphaera sp. GP187 TaxID=1882752 RepID=UPI0009297119|nr:efflux RND transporter periplasmic adaptor subunit [Singulisphaera sp. GP187]SIO62499.1 RND family efflux transporter, MFP subunit [Singulisphaera sp. GP187]